MKNLISSVICAIAIVFLGVALSGCATTEPVVKYETVVIAPEDNLLLDCPVTAPPNQTAYLQMTAREKEEALAAYGNKQTGNVGNCNIDKAGLRKWKAEQLKKYKTLSPKKGE